MTGRTVHAQETGHIGLVSLLVEKEERLMDVAMDKARIMLGKSRIGLRMTKDVLTRSLAASSLESAVRMEDLNQSICMTAPDFLKDVERFKNKKRKTN